MQKINELINLFDWNNEVAKLMLCEQYGQQVVFCLDGSVDSFEPSLQIDEPSAIAILRTSGHGNMNTSFFCDDFVEQNDSGEYVEIETGRVVGDLSNVIAECIEHGDISTLVESWQAEFTAQAKEWLRNNIMCSEFTDESGNLKLPAHVKSFKVFGRNKWRIEFATEQQAIEHRKKHGTGGWVLGPYLFPGGWTPSEVMLHSPGINGKLK